MTGLMTTMVDHNPIPKVLQKEQVACCEEEVGMTIMTTVFYQTDSLVCLVMQVIILVYDLL